MSSRLNIKAHQVAIKAFIGPFIQCRCQKRFVFEYWWTSLEQKWPSFVSKHYADEYIPFFDFLFMFWWQNNQNFKENMLLNLHLYEKYGKFLSSSVNLYSPGENLTIQEQSLGFRIRMSFQNLYGIQACQIRDKNSNDERFSNILHDYAMPYVGKIDCPKAR